MKTGSGNVEAAIVPQDQLSFALHAGLVRVALGDQIWCVARAAGGMVARFARRLRSR
jgi:hypothetical protein